ncbi:aminoglycoside phosphotransferase family protein [Lentzea sp. NPDC003310]|uniref:aminoglycoside phosphotransferase family protein n=1 Tax=Lentzea sp. NPDC003310 TaxID=3154447 RepID=UPI00339E23BE
MHSSLVDEMIRAQFPHWHGLPLVELEHGGTDHTIYRLGDELAVRLPRVEEARDQAARDFEVLPRLAPHLPLAVPEPVALGAPTERYPYRWSVVRWLPGEVSTIEAAGPHTGARLAEFLLALQKADTTGEPWTTYRGRHDISVGDAGVRWAIAKLGGDPVFTAIWDEAVAAPRWRGPLTWVHADLHRGNLLFTGDELTGVIDWGRAAAGDPAGDLMTAWWFLDERGRAQFRRELDGVDDATWARARGWALEFAVLELARRGDGNPFLAGIARHTLAQLRAERAG